MHCWISGDMALTSSVIKVMGFKVEKKTQLYANEGTVRLALTQVLQ